jgi:hypothetical protein
MDAEDREGEVEETYTKVDRRKLKDEPADPPEPEPPRVEDVPAEPGPEAGPGPEGEPAEQALADIGVYGVLRFCVSLLIQQAWVALGIQAPPGGETRQNLPEDKVAIDVLAYLVGQLAPDLEAGEQREMDNLLATLRLNYVRRAG